MIDEHKMYEDTKKLFNDLGIDVDPRRIMSTMPVSQRQMLEIAKAVSYDAKVIVFDEPTSSLTEQEVEHLFEIINMLRDKGCGIPDIKKAMEPLYTTGGEERAGLGFAVMQSFCDSVRVTSTPGRGTSVTLTKYFDTKQ